MNRKPLLKGEGSQPVCRRAKSTTRKEVFCFVLFFLFPSLSFKNVSCNVLLMRFAGVLYSWEGAVPEQQTGIAQSQPECPGEGKCCENSSLAGSVVFYNGTWPTPGAGELVFDALIWLGETGIRGHSDSRWQQPPCAIRACLFRNVLLLFSAEMVLDNPKNRHCQKERAGSQAGTGVSAGSAAPRQLGERICHGGDDSEPLAQGVLIANYLWSSYCGRFPQERCFFSSGIIPLGVARWTPAAAGGAELDLRAMSKGGGGTGIIFNSHICFPSQGTLQRTM